MVASTPGHSVSPINSSPLAQDSSRFSHSIFPSRREHAEPSSKPIPVPSTGPQLIYSPSNQPGRHPTSIPSPSSSASLDGHVVYPSAVSPSSRRRTSHSHSLAGSYTLSLLSSRMSNAHAPHSVSSAFKLQIGCSSFGKDVPARLRCPKHVKIDFDATYYDLDDGNSPGAVSTPWVGCVDLQDHYYRTLGNDDISGERVDCPPPRFPGYEVPSNGLLQLVIKNEFHPLKVFLVDYDLSALVPGGKMLVRERGYQAVSACNSRDDRRTTLGRCHSPTRRREVLRFAVEMQFTCVLESKTGDEKRSKKKKKEKKRGEVKSHIDDGIINTFNSRAPTPTPSNPYGTTKIRISKSNGRAYYLSKAIRIVFPPSADHGNQQLSSSSASATGGGGGGGGRSTPTIEKPDIRTERFVEVINPTITSGMRGEQVKALRKGSFASETWEGLREEWLRRMNEDTECDGRSADEDEIPVGDRGGNNLKRSPASSYETRDDFKSSTIKIQPQPVKSASLLSAKFSTRDLLPPIVDPYEGLDADGVPILRRDGSPRHRSNSPWDTTMRNGSYRGTIDSESERILSESLEKMVSPRKEGLRLGQPPAS